MTGLPGTAATTFGRDLIERQHRRAHAGIARPSPACPRPRWWLRPARSRCRRPRRSSAAPCVPSEPMPVRISARFQQPQTSAAEENSGSTAGLQKLHRRAVVEHDRRRCRRGARPSCAGRRARDRCGRPAPARRRPPRAPARPPARARCSARMVVKVGGMCCVISTGALSVTGVEPRRPARSAPAARRSRRRSAERAAASAENGRSLNVGRLGARPARLAT